jgi:hypothetical protein
LEEEGREVFTGCEAAALCPASMSEETEPRRRCFVVGGEEHHVLGGGEGHLLLPSIGLLSDLVDQKHESFNKGRRIKIRCNYIA